MRMARPVRWNIILNTEYPYTLIQVSFTCGCWLAPRGRPAPVRPVARGHTCGVGVYIRAVFYNLHPRIGSTITITQKI